MPSRRFSALLFFAALWMPVQLASQASPLSEVFPVAWPETSPQRTYLNGAIHGTETFLPGFPLTVALRHGFAVASLGSTATNDTVIDGKLLDLSGQPGPWFLGQLVEDGSEAILQDPAIAEAGPGGFVLAWSELPWNVLLLRFGPGGAPLGERIQLNQINQKWALVAPAVAGNAAGAFVAAWEGCYGSLCARAFDATGAPATAELEVSLPGAAGWPRGPRVGMDATGRFVVLWRQEEATGTAPARLCGQSYGVRGGFLGTSFCLGELAGSTGGALAVDPAGSFLAAWFGRPATTGARAPLYVRRLHLNGTPLAGPVQVATALDPSHLAASADGQGNAALSWQEGNQLRILLVRRDGVARGPALTLAGAVRPSNVPGSGVALSDSGRLLVTWQSGGLVLGQLWQARF